MRQVTFKGGPCDGLATEVDHRDITAVIRAAVVPATRLEAVPAIDPDETVTVEVPDRRAVVLTAAISREDLRAAHGQWVDYYRWPSAGDDDGPVEYRAERPPLFGSGFSASG